MVDGSAANKKTGMVKDKTSPDKILSLYVIAGDKVQKYKLKGTS